MANPIDKSHNLDNRRLELEQNIEKLRKAVRHWQTCEAEYEGFKEEIQKLGSGASAEAIQAVADDFGGDILTSKECRDILESSTGGRRDTAQISSILSRRLDYVQENVKAVQKQLAAAESGVTALDSIIEVQPRDEDGLPLQEITELLDENDNVISSNVVDTSSVAPEILKSLRKKGVKGIPEIEDSTSKGHSIDKATEKSHPQSPGPSTKSPSTKSELKPAELVDDQMTKKSAVQLSKQQPSVEPSGNVLTDNEHPRSSSVHEDVLRSLKDEFPDHPTIPLNETPEEAALRREMLEYNMNEVGAVVATMNLDQADNDDEDDDEYEEGSYDDDDSEEPEDEYGRTTVRVIDDKYRKEMLELEARLNARAIVNTGQAPSKPSIVNQDENALAKEQATQPAVPKPSKNGKKGVRFAESLDIAEPPPPPSGEPLGTVSKDLTERPITETIMERTSSPSSDLPPENSKKRISRFRSMRSESGGHPAKSPKTQMDPSITSGPLAGMHGSVLAPIAGKHSQSASVKPIEPDDGTPKPILADTLVERPMEETGGRVSLEPDEFDPAIMHPQVAKEYHRIRSRLIQRNGGFVEQNDADENQGQEDENGKKISRFKAAKISQIRK